MLIQAPSSTAADTKPSPRRERGLLFSPVLGVKLQNEGDRPAEVLQTLPACPNYAAFLHQRRRFGSGGKLTYLVSVVIFLTTVVGELPICPASFNANANLTLEFSLTAAII